MTRSPAARRVAKTGLVGLIAGEVKQRDFLLVAGAIALIAQAVWRLAGFLVAFVVAVALFAIFGLVVRVRKRRAGVAMDSAEY